MSENQKYIAKLAKFIYIYIYILYYIILYISYIYINFIRIYIKREKESFELSKI